MTLASEIVALLTLSTHAMNHLTSPGQHALLSAEERKSALLQIMITVQVAAKLAESAHLDAVTHNEPGGGGSGDTERIRANTERL
ncbi:uncharacterized protein H6S33_007147 [Morchella sextelata]|uniref:uncharacterized protein n=1 Tax=Morchella sextelata TaxID=1174677 RepID=UPI001D04C156|nr:uncharacterized protein H6S33_007147 [Morchella sextelata]KAH0604116.1 hypothetical protein H6S33_007147 [Morchella sextelata]